VLNKKNRLPIKGRLKTIKTVVSPLFVVKVATNQTQQARFAIIISKEVDKRAVFRNSLKRKLSEALTKTIVNIIPGHDFLIIVKKEAVKKQSEELQREIFNSLKKENFTI
jgi:ribonuclease P protein component